MLRAPRLETRRCSDRSRCRVNPKLYDLGCAGISPPSATGSASCGMKFLRGCRPAPNLSELNPESIQLSVRPRAAKVNSRGPPVVRSGIYTGSVGSIAPVRCQWEQSLSGPQRRVADPLYASHRRTSSSEAQRTTARETGQSQVSASADIRLPAPNDSSQSAADIAGDLGGGWWPTPSDQRVTSSRPIERLLPLDSAVAAEPSATFAAPNLMPQTASHRGTYLGT